MSELTAARQERLMADLRRLIHDAETLAAGGADDLGDDLAAARERLSTRVDQARASLQELQETVVGKGKAAGRVADDYVHDNPWKAIGAAAGAGLLLGLLIGRR